MKKTQRNKNTKTQKLKDTKTKKNKHKERQYIKKKTKETKNIKKYKNIGGAAAVAVDATAAAAATDNSTFKSQILKSFPLDFDNKEKLLMCNYEGSYSITSIVIFAPLIKYIHELFAHRNNDLTLIDANANMGSDTIKFGVSNLFSHIDSIELNEENYKLLKNNIKVYSDEDLIPTNLIGSYNANCFTFINTIPEVKIVDIMYFDPPWKINGDPWSKTQSNLNLTLSNEDHSEITMPDIVNTYKTKANVFIFKLPYNYDFKLFNYLNTDTEFNIYILGPSTYKWQSIRFVIIFKKDSSILDLTVNKELQTLSNYIKIQEKFQTSTSSTSSTPKYIPQYRRAAASLN